MSNDLLSNGNITFFTDVSRAKILHGLTFGANLYFVPLSCNVSPQHMVMEDRYEGFVGATALGQATAPPLVSPDSAKGWIRTLRARATAPGKTHPAVAPVSTSTHFCFSHCFGTTSTMLIQAQASHHHTAHNSKTHSHRRA